MVFLSMPQQLVVGTELPMQSFRAVAPYRQTAALLRAVLSKGPDDDKAAGLHRAVDYLEVPQPILRPCQKVVNSAIVPEIELVSLELHLGYVRLQPMDIAGFSTKPCLRYC